MARDAAQDDFFHEMETEKVFDQGPLMHVYWKGLTLTFNILHK